MRARSTWLVSPLLISLAFAVWPSAGSDRLSEILAAMKQAGDGLRTLSARFEQTRHDQILGENTTTSGRIYLQVPGRIRWEYDPPDSKVLLVKEDKVLLYNAAARQVQEFKAGQMKGAGGDLLIGFGRSNAEIRKHYQVSLLREEPAVVALKLVPRGEGPASLFTAIEITMDKERWIPVRTRFFELNQDTTELLFRQARVNGPLPPRIFDLKLPAGVEFLRGDEFAGAPPGL